MKTFQSTLLHAVDYSRYIIYFNIFQRIKLYLLHLIISSSRAQGKNKKHDQT